MINSFETIRAWSICFLLVEPYTFRSKWYTRRIEECGDMPKFQKYMNSLRANGSQFQSMHNKTHEWS